MVREQEIKHDINSATIKDVEEIRSMQAQSWRDTYRNDEIGVTEEWLVEETARWMTPDSLAYSKEYLGKVFSDPDQFYRIARIEGRIVGLIHLTSRENGIKHLQGLYTDKSTHGSGLAQQLMQEAEHYIGDSEAELSVASYNERAKAFYRKYGFEEVDRENELFKGKIPNTTMVKQRRKNEV